MNSYYSALLSASCILIFSQIALSLKVKNCVLPKNLTLQISKNQRATFYESDLTVIMDYDALNLIWYERTNSLNVQANKVEVNFNGIMLMESDDPVKPPQPQVISRKYNDRISGVAQRQRLNSSAIDYPMDGCRIVLLSNEMDRPGMTARIANEIRRLAESCIERDLCEDIAKMKPQFRSKLPIDNKSNLMFDCPDPLIIVNDGCEEIYDKDIVQPIANKAVDVALNEMSEYLGAMNGGTFSIPDMKKEFSTGTGIFKTNGYFKAIDGKFRDLTTIHRVSDVTLSHNAMKVSAACEFGLEVADLRYPYYELKYGAITVRGEVAGRVENSALVIRVAIDYNRKPCHISMEYLKITKFGDMQIHLTGLYPLNSLTTTLLNWITMSWKNQIVVTMEQQLLESVEKQLSNFDCEKYRP